MKFRYAGSHIQHGILKVGVAFIPEEGKDESFAVQHVKKPIIPPEGIPEGLEGEELKAWIDSLLASPDTSYWETNPAFTHFIKINPSTTLPDLEAEIQRIFTPDVLTSADNFLSIRGTGTQERRGFSSYRKMMAAHERLGNGLVLPKGYNAQGLITAANNKFRGLGGELDSEGKILDIKPGTIDIGAAAIDRGSSSSNTNATYIGKENPANADGLITSVEIWATTEMEGVEVANFEEVDTNTFTTRDNETLGTIASGSKQTRSGLDMTVATGDYLGIYFTGGTIERDSTGDGRWYCSSSADWIPCTDQLFFSQANQTLSLYGEGEIPVDPPTVTTQDATDIGFD